MAVNSTLLVKGGRVVTASDVFEADVLVQGEKIVAVGKDQGWSADQTIDARGRLVLPGGVDVHTHLEEPMNFVTMTADNFASGTTAAAVGGTTTIIDFAKRFPDSGLYESFLGRLKVAEGNCLIDYSFHAMTTHTGLSDGGLDDMRRLAAEGVTSFKFFMAYPDVMMVDDATILSAMRVAAELGLMIMVHAENGAMVAEATERLVQQGRTEEHAHTLAHPHLAEEEAAYRAIALAELAGCPLFVVHVSSRYAAEVIGNARAEGRLVWGETCPQYLVAAYEDYQDKGYEAAKYICAPPIRERANQDDLWRALSTDVLSTVGTDHASFCIGDPPDLPPQKSSGRGYFPKLPLGVPGIEDRLKVVYEFGVKRDRLSLSRFVDVMSTRPAKLFGLYPQKGTLAVGSDADIVVWDPDAQQTISAKTHRMRVDYNIYEGMVVSGSPSHVVSRGELIVDGERLLGSLGRGRYLKRGEVNTS